MHNKMMERLHWLDLHTAGTIKSDSPITNPHTKSEYLVRSLIDEAISSSQLEGASTTRHAAKEMIRQERTPKDKSEQMIFNNYHAMQFIKEIKNEKLTPDIICELHSIVVDKTLDDELMSGKFRTEEDRVDVIDQTDGEILHTPPPASELSYRLDLICKFANDEIETEFIHPIIKAIILHFMLAYEHPFIDGNGRTARALFYWSIARQGYWLMEFISISKIIHKAPIQYGRAFLYTETDDNDLTYFIDHQLKVIEESVTELFDYLNKKVDEIREAELLLQNTSLQSRLNFRQMSILRHALKHPRYLYNIKEHQATHSITYQTARNDLLTMSEDMGLLVKLKREKTFVFMSPDNLGDILKGKD